MRHVVIVLMLAVSVACSKKITNTQVDIKAIVENELGSSTQQQLNNNNTYLLAVKNKEVTENHTVFIIIDVISGEIVKKGAYSPGHIKWIDNDSLELLSVPGNIPQGKNLEDYKSIITLPKSN